MNYSDIAAAASALHLVPMGGFSEDGKTTVLLGPLEPGFWGYVSQSSEFQGDNPLDNWSVWAITALGDATGSTPMFPFGGPPHHPFISWALRSGEAWQSPVGLLIHKDAGLLASYRGALVFDRAISMPTPAAIPCGTCTDKPCLSACPVGALDGSAYDVPACKAHIETDTVCRAGCRVRLACPISMGYGRNAAQTAFHMSAFLGE